MDDQILDNVALGIVDGQTDPAARNGVPAELVSALIDALGVDSRTAIEASRIVLRAMATMRVVDIEQQQDSHDDSDCAYS
jgi:hypothetical protein